MIKRFIIIAAMIGMLASCRHPSSNNSDDEFDEPNNPQYPDNPQNNTAIVFDNTQGICAVSVYEDYRRRDEDKITIIPAGGSSVEIAWMSGASVPFYFSYAVTFKGISGFTLNYVPEIGKDQKAVRIDADTTTTIKVPTLSETFSSSDTLLSNNSYLYIQNNSSYSFELQQGTSKIKPDNISSYLVNNGEKAQYTINPGPVSNYRLLVGADYKEFSGSIVNFEAGHIYNFDYNGSISMVSNIELKLENVNGVTIPQTPPAPVVISSNGSISLQWNSVESATAYEIWMATVNDSASASKQGADVVASLSATINGLNNGTTYYFWLKAKNNLGTSGFSPVAFGTPSAATVKPSDPKTAPSIIAGNGQLTVNWQAVADASVYEVWAGTINNAQSAAKQCGDESSLSTVITGLNNGTTYYIWIKAKNNIGVSGFSPTASGKPLGTPGTPTVSPVYKGLLITWTAVAGADQYEVYYGIGTPTTLATTTNGTTATISGLTAGTTYDVRLRAKNANGISEYGSSASGVPDNNISAGLYKGAQKIGNQNLADSLSYISSNAVSGDEYFIVLGTNDSISPKTLSYSGKTVKITLLGSGSERTITLNANGSMFTVNYSGVTLTLDENISLVGTSTNNNSLVYVNNGNLIMNDGAKISGNANSLGNGYCGGVYVNGTFTMNGGEISGNSASIGGGVFVGESKTFIMNGGKIKGNTARGGGVFVNSGNFIMHGGIISGNSGSQGGGIEVSGGSFTMHGGIISGNSASNVGSGIYVGSGTFKKNPPSGGQNSGIIYGSEAVGVDADGVLLKSSSAVISSPQRRNTTAWETDQIDTTTGKGLSANGNPPFGQ